MDDFDFVKIFDNSESIDQSWGSKIAEPKSVPLKKKNNYSILSVNYFNYKFWLQSQKFNLGEYEGI